MSTIILPYTPARLQMKDACTAWATVSAMETWILAHAPDLVGHLPLCEEDLLELTRGSDDLRRAVALAAKAGIVERSAPQRYRDVPGHMRPEKHGWFWRLGAVLVRHGPKKIPIMTAQLEAGYPLLTRIWINPDFEGHTGPAPYVRKKQPGIPHAVCIIGVDLAQGLWIAKNSMGAGWGWKQGCFTMPIGEPWVGAEDDVWTINRVLPPSSR